MTLDPNISASDYATKLAELRSNQPRPIHKLWNNPSLAPVEAVAAQTERIKVWNREYRQISKLQKLALERDNAAFRARYA